VVVVVSDELRNLRSNVPPVHLWWRERGNGLPIVLVPGGPGVASDYLDPLLELLTTDVRVIQFDPRGCGRLPPPHDLATSLADLEGLRAATGIDRWVLVGHSAGANVVLAYALDFSVQIPGIIAIAGGAGVTDDRQWHAAYEAGRDAGLDPLPDSRYPANMAVNREGNASWKRFTKQPDLLRRIACLEVPFLAIHGSQDIRPAWPIQQLAALMPRAEFATIDGGRHMP
jgi:proline iminopeptidase